MGHCAFTARMQGAAEYSVHDESFGCWIAWIEGRYFCLRRPSSWARFFASRANGMIRRHALCDATMARLPGHWLSVECAGAVYRYHGPDADAFEIEMLSSKARVAIRDAPSSAPSGARGVCCICFDEEILEANPIVTVCQCRAGFHLECMVACHVAGIARCPACRRALVIDGM